MSLDPSRKLQDEVTRVESVGYLQGATGHAVYSLVFLGVTSVGYWLTGWLAVAFGGIAGAFLVTANGLSIYLWDVITRYVWMQDTSDEEMPGEADSGESRTLSVSLTPSTAHKAEFAASVFQVLVLVVTLTLIVQTVQRFEPETASILLASVLFVGNAGALILKYLGLI